MQPGKGLMTLNILHKAMLAGQLIFAGIAFYMVYTNQVEFPMKENDRIFQIVSIVLAAGGFFAGVTLFKKKLQAIRDMNTDAKGKFAAYRSACIMQWALIEGPCLFCLVAFFLIGNYSFLALAVGLILLFILQAPARAKVMIQLGLSEQEIDSL